MSGPVSRATYGMATAIAAGGPLLTGWMLVRGFDLSFSLCAMGGCSEPEDGGLGAALMLGGLALLIAVPLAVPRLAGRDRSGARAVAAVATTLAVGLWAALVGNRFGGWTENVALYVTIATFIVVLVPPRGPWWAAGFVGGGAVAASFGDVPLPGAAIGLVILSLGSATDEPHEPDQVTGPTTR